jgi:hypothetical protein
MSAIVGGCMPYTNQNRVDDCGSYFVDLSENSEFSVGRSIIDLPVNSSCTYRAMSTCGYPQFFYRVNDAMIAEDFDVAWAFEDYLPKNEELSRWEFDHMTDSQNSSTTYHSAEYLRVHRPINGTIADSQWNNCNGINRNLWVSITRVKNSDPKGELRAARQLQYYPNGTHFADFDITFSNYKASASFIKVFSMALIAGVAALAF